MRERPRGGQVLSDDGDAWILGRARLACPKPWNLWLASSRIASARVRSPSSVNEMFTAQLCSGMEHLLGTLMSFGSSSHPSAVDAIEHAAALAADQGAEMVVVRHGRSALIERGSIAALLKATGSQRAAPPRTDGSRLIAVG
jgi:hypothetical protein